MQIVNLRVTHPCPFARPVTAEEGTRVTHLCHRGREAILEIHATEPAAAVRVVGAYRSIGGEVLYEDPESGAALVRFARCACCGSGRVIPTIEGQGYLYLPPSRYGPAGESYQFLAEAERLDPGVLGHLPDEVQVVEAGTKPLTSLEFEGGFLVPIGALFHELTVRQREALVRAILRGYYRIPRTVRTEQLAESLGISRPGFESLLRKAENKLIAAVFPYLTVQAPPPPAVAEESRG